MGHGAQGREGGLAVAPVLALLLVLFFLSRGLRSKKSEPVALPAIGPGSVAAAIAAVHSGSADGTVELSFSK